MRVDKWLRVGEREYRKNTEKAGGSPMGLAIRDITKNSFLLRRHLQDDIYLQLNAGVCTKSPFTLIRPVGLNGLKYAPK